MKFLLLPITVGLGFEFIMYAGRHDNVLTKILSAPGLWMQRLTTKNPDKSQLEIAITALKGAMPDEFGPLEGVHRDGDTDTDTDTENEDAVPPVLDGDEDGAETGAGNDSEGDN